MQSKYPGPGWLLEQGEWKKSPRPKGRGRQDVELGHGPTVKPNGEDEG